MTTALQELQVLGIKNIDHMEGELLPDMEAIGRLAGAAKDKGRDFVFEGCLHHKPAGALLMCVFWYGYQRLLCREMEDAVTEQELPR